MAKEPAKETSEVVPMGDLPSRLVLEKASIGLWDYVERLLKIAGIIGGLAAAGGVYVQLKDLNDQDARRKVETWQASVVYKIVEDNKQITFDDISLKYVNEAQKVKDNIPQERLGDDQLQLVLLRLMQGQSIVEIRDRTYSVKHYSDPQQLVVSNLLAQVELNNKVARHIRLARQILADATKPMTIGQFQDKMITAGGSEDFVRQNISLLLETLQNIGVARIEDDMIEKINQPPFERKSSVEIPAGLSEVIGKMSLPDVQFIMTNDPDMQFKSCTQNSAAPQISEDWTRLSKLGLINIKTNSEAERINNIECSSVSWFEFTETGNKVREFLFQMMKDQIVASILAKSHL